MASRRLLRLLRWIQVRVVLPCQPAVGASNVVAGSRAVDFQNLVVVAFASHSVLRHVLPAPSSWTAAKTNQSAGSRAARGGGIGTPNARSLVGTAVFLPSDSTLTISPASTELRQNQW